MFWETENTLALHKKKNESELELSVSYFRSPKTPNTQLQMIRLNIGMQVV